MKEITFLHFYRQDVLKDSRKSRLFNIFSKDIKDRTIGSLLGHVHELKDYCYGRYTVDEASAFFEDETLELTYCYTLCVFGKGGDVGFIFRLCVPIDERNPTRIRRRCGGRMFEKRVYL